MNKIVVRPNLPSNRLKSCLIGEGNIDEIRELSDLGITCIQLKKSDVLDDEIASHADVLAFNSGCGKVYINKESVPDAFLPFELYSNIILSEEYPFDSLLNIALIGKNVVCNTKYAAKIILEELESNGYKIIHTNQGYAKCSLCIVNDSAVITEDNGIVNLLKNYQFDILKIEPGYVYLSQKHSGFIGGASAKLSENEIYFSGNIEAHKDYKNIKAFLNNYKIDAIYNPGRKFRDFGGLISLTEEI